MHAPYKSTHANRLIIIGCLLIEINITPQSTYIGRPLRNLPQKQTEARTDEYAFTLGLIYELGE